eukprot:scaffold4434_cov109-Isochrysis_galbana.AAC.1
MLGRRLLGRGQLAPRLKRCDGRRSAPRPRLGRPAQHLPRCTFRRRQRVPVADAWQMCGGTSQQRARPTGAYQRLSRPNHRMT